MNFLVKYKQFGFKGTASRICKHLLRKIGLFYNSYFYFTAKVNPSILQKIWGDNPIKNVKKLSYSDFLLGEKSIFNEKKLNLIKCRFSQENDYVAYGIVENNMLLYSCWIGLKYFETSSAIVSDKLKEDEFLLLDAYCNPLARGRGIHTSMNAYRCMKAMELGRFVCVAVVLKENIPAKKVQKKCGLDIAFKYYVLKVFGKSYTNFFKKKENFLKNKNEK